MGNCNFASTKLAITPSATRYYICNFEYETWTETRESGSKQVPSSHTSIGGEKDDSLQSTIAKISTGTSDSLIFLTSSQPVIAPAL